MTAGSVRIDKWLWAARFFKTRTLAATAVDNGRVKLNGERVKPAHAVKLGDLLDIDNGAVRWEVAVQGLSETRGPATAAQALYAETDAGRARRAQEAEQRKYFREPGAALKERPTKRDRRRLDKTSF
jgi:ribosome-associated heat shock protein Hsp15